MKRNPLWIWPVLLAALTLTGCRESSRESMTAGESVEIGPKYSAQNGLLVPEETRLSLGLKIVEVTERRISARLAVQLRVYHAGKESVLASASVTPEEARTLRRGQVVRGTSNGADLAGRVRRVDAEWQQATGMAELLVEFDHASEAPVVGTFFAASVDLGSDATVLTIPRAALLECSDGPSVYAVSGEYLVRVPVEAGAINAEWVEIKDGLYAGDQVVLQPVISLWLTELAAVKGGQACCVVPAKGK